MDIRSIRLNNLKYAVHEAGGVDRLAERAGVSRKYLDQILQGFQGRRDKNPRRVGDALAARLAAGLGQPAHWMDLPHPDLWRELSPHAVADEPTGRLVSFHPARLGRPDHGNVLIAQFDTGGAMGNGLELRDQPGVIQSWNVSPEWLQKNVRGFSASKNLCIVTGFGDSMRPMFNPGDPLIVDRGVQAVEYDAIYFFRVGSEGFIKRLQRIPTAAGLVVRAKSENTKYDAWDITEGMDFEVFGRVLKVWRSEDF
ncbi:S24 family peptidase [Achromobacter deleyi]|uniref:S24 family peptidase n=1 Tax=Achromobacter deleyi TaxID=1353891 RepID=A0A7T4B369_9BURK|nr:S24 family peptidase [Achromobacter deleyi]QQB34704.1 S24 family peptidase [Achromobacter deleyi]